MQLGHMHNIYSSEIKVFNCVAYICVGMRYALKITFLWHSRPRLISLLMISHAGPRRYCNVIPLEGSQAMISSTQSPPPTHRGDKVVQLIN